MKRFTNLSTSAEAGHRTKFGMTVGTKLWSGFGVMFALLIILGTTVLINLTRIDKQFSFVIKHDAPVIKNANKLMKLVVDMETGQRGFIITGKEEFLDPYNTGKQSFAALIIEEIKMVNDDPAQVKRLERINALIDEWFEKAGIPGINARRRMDKQQITFDEVSSMVQKGTGKTILDEIRKEFDTFLQIENDLTKERYADASATFNTTRYVTMIIVVISVLFGILVAWLLSRNITVPLRAISTYASQITVGDLTMDIPSVERSDEVGVLIQTFRLMVENLRRLTSDINEGVNQLNASASEILAATTQVASGTAESATAISETTTTVEEVRQAAQLSSQKAKNVSDSAQRVVQISQTGRKSVEETVGGMNNIRTQMEAIANTIVSLSGQSQSIGGIIATVTDISDQSNLLAVNAAIEAARAGEQGKGFAVVAQEIRSLAEQSKQATTQVRGILSDIQKATSAAVMATEQGSKAVESGVKQSVQAGEAIRALAETSEEAVQAATQIAASSQQQIVGMDQIGVAMENINQAGAETATSMRQAEIAARNLHELGQKLQGLAEKFKVKGGV